MKYTGCGSVDQNGTPDTVTSYTSFGLRLDRNFEDPELKMAGAINYLFQYHVFFIQFQLIFMS